MSSEAPLVLPASDAVTSQGIGGRPPHQIQILLDRIAARLSPELLPIFGTERKPERESISRYYLLRAIPRGISSRSHNQLVRLEALTGEEFYATIGHLSTRRLDRTCWMIVGIHHGDEWFHRHILQIWFTDSLPPSPLRSPASGAHKQRTPLAARRRSHRVQTNVGRSQPRLPSGHWRALPARFILDAEDAG